MWLTYAYEYTDFCWDYLAYYARSLPNLYENFLVYLIEWRAKPSTKLTQEQHQKKWENKLYLSFFLLFIQRIMNLYYNFWQSCFMFTALKWILIYLYGGSSDVQLWELFSRSFSPLMYDNFAAYAINLMVLLRSVWSPAIKGAFILSQESQLIFI